MTVSDDREDEPRDPSNRAAVVPPAVDVEAMTAAELGRVVHGANGYARYILETGEPGQGHDGAHDHAEWQRARRRLAYLDAATAWSHVRDPEPGPDLPMPSPPSSGGGPDERGSRFCEQLAWPVNDMPMFRDVLGAAGDIQLVVMASGPMHRLVFAENQPYLDALSLTERAPGAATDWAIDAISGLADQAGHDHLAVYQPLDSLASALTGELGGRAGAEDWLAPGWDSQGTGESWPAGSDDAARGGWERTRWDHALGLVSHAVSAIAPALGWLARHLGAARAAASVLDQFFDVREQSGPSVCMTVRIADSARVRPVRGCIALAGGSLVYEPAADSTGTAEAVIEPASDHGRIEMALRAPGSAIELAFIGDMRALDIAALMVGIQAAVERMLVLFSKDIWPVVWDTCTAGNTLHELVAHDVHELMPSSWRARLIRELCASICDDARERAILRVLESSVALGDIAEVLDQFGGPGATAELLWTLDREHHTQLTDLFQAADVAY